MLLGTAVDALSIIIGGMIGFLLKSGIQKRYDDIIVNGIGLCVILIGVQGALKVTNMLLIIISVVIGGIIGEFIDIECYLKKLGDGIENKLKGRGGKISEGFITSSLLFCVGAMAIVGSLESGLTGNNKMLFTKSVLDGVSAIVLTSSLGAGVLISSVSVFVYQGLITVAASFIKTVMTKAVINDMTAIGSLLIIGLGFNMLGIAKMKIANLLPGIFIPVVYQIIIGILK